MKQRGTGNSPFHPLVPFRLYWPGGLGAERRGRHVGCEENEGTFKGPLHSARLTASPSPQLGGYALMSVTEAMPSESLILLTPLILIKDDLCTFL